MSTRRRRRHTTQRPAFLMAAATMFPLSSTCHHRLTALTILMSHYNRTNMTPAARRLLYTSRDLTRSGRFGAAQCFYHNLVRLIRK